MKTHYVIERVAFAQPSAHAHTAPGRPRFARIMRTDNRSKAILHLQALITDTEAQCYSTDYFYRLVERYEYDDAELSTPDSVRLHIGMREDGCAEISDDEGTEYVKNSKGTWVDYNDSAAEMCRALADEIRQYLGSCSSQRFFAEYADRYRERFGAEFPPDIVERVQPCNG